MTQQQKNELIELFRRYNAAKEYETTCYANDTEWGKQLAEKTCYELVKRISAIWLQMTENERIQYRGLI